MFDRIGNGWEMAKQSLHVLRLDKELLLFPVFSGIACILVMLTFALPIYFSGMLDLPEEMSQGQKAMFSVLGFLYYFVNYFVIIFFNSALVACAIIRLNGGDPTVSDGIGAAMARLPQIASWALVAASVGMILKTIESRSARVGQIVASVIGMAWSITTFFVIPILVVEKAGPIEAFKRSVNVMKKTWGESLGANFGIGLITMIAFALGLVPLLGGVFLVGSVAALGWVLVAIGIIWMLTVSLISSALSSIVLAALYIHAAEGKNPQYFDAGMMQNAFSPR